MMVLDNKVLAASDPKPEEPEEDEEEELEDPQDTLKEECREKAECQKLRAVLEECNDRVNSKSKTSETCDQELYDFVHCVDHCVAKSLFSRLK
ncbi:cytochrome b-c1 complex subunit 6, mitochondrial-like [Liolophura sinensis]|uniref:cytochrome b-c1 complex subunit 6, mitochondrial-like n=1 Tax=Liolophura sinensis TaxID=3198878 RepID=UPI003158B341